MSPEPSLPPFSSPQFGSEFEGAADHLMDDLQPVQLADAAQVRGMGERRRRNQLAIAVVGVVVLVAAAAGGTWLFAATGGGTDLPPASGPVTGVAETTPPATGSGVPPDSSMKPPNVASPTPKTGTTKRTPGAKTTTPPVFPPGRINVSRLLPGLRDSIDPDAGSFTYFAPPRPCGTADRPSDGDLIAFGAAYGPLDYEPEPGQHTPEVVVEYLADFRDAAAETFMTELRADVAACPGQVGDGLSAGGFQWSLVDRDFVGDESVLLKLTGGSAGYQSTTNDGVVYVAVARTGNTIVAVTELGWEGNNGVLAFTLAKIAEAVALQ